MQAQTQAQSTGGAPVLSAQEIAAHREALERAAALPLPDEARALAVAAVAHQRQFRKGTGLPYITHLIEVHAIVSQVAGTTTAQRVAAILHDYDEDVEYTHSRPGDIARWFGDDAAAHVSWLTDVSKPEDGNRATRRSIDREHSAKAPPETQTIKYGDILSNARNVVQILPNFAAVWLPEKVALMEVIPSGDQELRKIVMDVLDGQLARLAAINGGLNDNKRRGVRP